MSTWAVREVYHYKRMDGTVRGPPEPMSYWQVRFDEHRCSSRQVLDFLVVAELIRDPEHFRIEWSDNGLAAVVVSRASNKPVFLLTKEST